MAQAIQQSNKRVKRELKFLNLPIYDTENYEVYLGDHYSGQKMPMICSNYTKGKYDNAILRSPVMCVRYSNLGPSGDIGTCNGMIKEENAKFTVDVNTNLPEYYTDIVSDGQARADNFVAFLKEKTDEMLELAWKNNCMGSWVEKAMKKAKKEAKKSGGDVDQLAFKIFKEDATLSLFREDEDGNPIFNFRRRYRTNAGKLNRPLIWRTNKEGKYHEISDDVPWVAKDSLVQFDFCLNMYSLPQKYGIQGQLGTTIVAVKLEKHSKKEETPVVSENPYFDF